MVVEVVRDLGILEQNSGSKKKKSSCLSRNNTITYKGILQIICLEVQTIINVKDQDIFDAETQNPNWCGVHRMFRVFIVDQMPLIFKQWIEQVFDVALFQDGGATEGGARFTSSCKFCRSRDVVQVYLSLKLNTLLKTGPLPVSSHLPHPLQL